MLEGFAGFQAQTMRGADLEFDQSGLGAGGQGCRNHRSGQAQGINADLRSGRGEDITFAAQIGHGKFFGTQKHDFARHQDRGFAGGIVP